MVLDLDETLVHCVMEPIAHYDRKFTVGFLASHDADRVQHGDSRCVCALPSLYEGVYRGGFEAIRGRRVHCISKLVRIERFSDCSYADSLLDIIDPEHKIK